MLKFTKLIKTIMTTFISFNLIYSPAFASEGAGAYERTADKIEQFIKSGKPSDIPFLDYTDNFTSASSQPLKQFDLSSFVGKKMFVGYGTYDDNQNFCRYIEKPGSVFPASDIKQFTKFNKHSYAISMAPMSYYNCKTLAAKYGGNPMMINSSSENNFVSGAYKGLNKWVGATRQSCVSPNYKNAIEGKQDYFNWSSTSEKVGTCDNSKLFTKQNSYGTWNKVSDSELNYCVVEVDSEDFTRPIKLCAPWWKIEREFALPKATTYEGVDVFRVNQADIPDQFDVCTKYSTPSITSYAEQPNRQVTCTSYYDATLDPVCVRNPYQAICKVDECTGYIKNACTLKESFTGFKNYTKTELGIDGENVIAKGKIGIQTHVYSCPPSLPSMKNCQEQSTVMIYPKECPGTDCEAYKACYANATTTDERTACATAHPCEKIYGSADKPVFDAAGNLTHLKGTCSDGTELLFEPNIQSKESRKCLEYEKYTVTETVTQKCLLERPFSDFKIDTSLTEEDIYQSNPNCLRMNNVIDARPLVQVKLDYVNNGYAKTVVRKAFLDGSMQTIVDEGSNSTFIEAAMNATDPFANIKTTQTVSSTPKYDCSVYNEAWYNRQNMILNIPVAITVLGVNKSYLANSFGMEPSGELFAKFSNVANTNDCTALKAKLGGTTDLYTTETKECKVYLNKYAADTFSLIKGNGNLITDAEGSEYPDYSYITKDAITKTDCDKIAYCLNGIYNESAYVSSSTAQCSVIMGDNYDYKDIDISTLQEIEPMSTTTFDKDCKPYATKGAFASNLDGTKDIFSIQEVVDGSFGYFSNYNTHPFVNNITKINGKEVYPLKPIPTLDDPLIYEADFTQWAITTKKPNLIAGAIAGAGAGVAYGLMVAFGAMAFGIGLVVLVLVAMIMGKIQKFNREKFEWTIYKLVPQHRYVNNVYGYDKRILGKNDNGSVFIDGQNRYKLIYSTLKGDSGTLKPGEFKTWLKNTLMTKENLITCLGWERTVVESLRTPLEAEAKVEFPKCKKLSWSCNKENVDDDEKTQNPFFKKMNNVYIGATNGISIVVPYLGDYELKAYDGADNLLSTINIKEDEFLEASDNTAKYAQVPFGLGMNLAQGINEGLENNACRSDLMVEWGGGISGIYFENNNTGNNQDCQKSFDAYVQAKSATYITIKATNMDRPFKVELQRPLPFANRVFLVTLNEKEIREYRCYDEFGKCGEEQFK